MDFRHLKYFITVAEELNIGRAAARLHISQPPLTRQIQQLEEQLGVQLFVRTPKGVELTQAGALFLDEARNISTLLELAIERTKRAGQGKLGIPNGIMGLSPSGGAVSFKGQPVTLNAPRAALERSMAFVSEDRRGVGLLLDEGIDWNIAFTAMQVQDKYLKPMLGGLFMWRSDEEMTKLAQEYIQRLQIKCTGPRQRAGNLSGGNQQKVVLAKWILTRPKVLILDAPTVGVDIGAKDSIYKLIHRLSGVGISVLLITDEAPEAYYNCDRVLHMKQGKIINELIPSTLSEHQFAEAING